jgi:hypothetical protein
LLVAAILKADGASTSTNSTEIETVVKVEFGNATSLIEFGNSTGEPIPIPGTQFNATVKICNVTNLYGFDLKFRWNTTYLEYVSHSVRVPKDTYPDGVLWKPILELANEVNTSAGTYWIAYSSMAPVPSFNGTGTIFTMTFEVTNQPYDYETGGSTVDPIDTVLDFLSTDLAPRVLEEPIMPIPHTTENATVRIWEKRSELPAEPILKVEPAEVENLPKCETFDINISIISVGSQYDVQSFNITLNFNSTLIEAISITEGPWPRNYANNTMEILKQINNAKGTATYAIELIPPRKPYPPTTGILFTVTFNVTYESPTYPQPTSEITLDPTEILDRNTGPISHITENGTYTAFRPPPIAEVVVVNPLTGNNNFTFYTNITSVGSHFNATIWVYNVTNLHAYQIHLDYNSTLLRVTMAWLPTWLPQWIFYGKTTTGLPPSFGDNYVEIGDAIIGTHPAFSVTGILGIIEFEIIYAPATEEISCSLNVNNTDTLLLDSNWNEILSIKTNGHYIYMYKKLSSTISITISPSTIDFGENTTISGVIDPPRSTNVTLLYRLQGETEWKNLTIAPTNNKGTYSYNWTPPKAGDYIIRASWPGDENTLPASQTGTLIVNKAVPTITINVYPTQVTLGSNVTINGTISLTTLGINFNITIQYRLQEDVEWTQLATVQTDTLGQYTHLWRPDKEGIYELRAIWLGDQNTHPAESEHKTVKVEAQPIEIVPYIVAGIVIVAIIVTAAIYLVKIRKPHK